MKNFCASLLLLVAVACSDSLPENSNKVESILYLGEGENQPLVVGLGGSEGGNAWASQRWKKTRDRFINEGYAFLAIGYFGAEGTPDVVDRISIDAVHDAIVAAADNRLVDKSRIAVIGGSKGAELALLLASKYPTIGCVVSLVGSHCTFPALTWSASTSSWTHQGEEVPFVPMTWGATPAAIKGDLRAAFSIMLEDREATEKALIEVENINGPIFLLSAKRDEMWPSAEMSDEVINRLKQKNFPHTYRHIAIDGGHTDVLDHFDSVFVFMRENFPAE